MANEIGPTLLPQYDVAIPRPPGVIVAEAHEAAKVLRDVLSRKDKPVKFNGEQYLEFEDWQTLGKFYGVGCATLQPRPVTINGVEGAEAEAEIRVISTGQVIGRASAWCLRDEPNWKSKPWFQIASMAQTRAGAKAFRNMLSWVVVLAGYKPTPAEEMTAETISAKQEKETTALETSNPLVAEIMSMLGQLHNGNMEEVEKHLKFVTMYKAKDGNEKWLTTDALEGVAKHKPEWIERIHKKVLSAYNMATSQ